MDPQTRTLARYLGVVPPRSYPRDSAAVDVIAAGLAICVVLLAWIVAGGAG